MLCYVNLVKTKVMMCNIGHVTVRPSSKKDPCGMCGRRTMVDAVLCKSCEKKVMVSNIGHVTVRPSSNKYPCGMCGRRTMVDAVLCESCEAKGHGE